jgi:DNA adenine methylase
MLFMASGTTARTRRAAIDPQPRQPRPRAVARTLPAAPRARALQQLPPASPVVKWVGGKTRLLGELIDRLPERIGRYYEPFAGGAALFFRVAPARAVLNDYNADLIATYRALATGADAVVRKLAYHRQHHGRTHYYDMRERWNDPARTWAPHERAAAFIYLNKTCFNGLWRVNRSGRFNVPMGRYDDPPICVPDALAAASVVLARAELRCGDYRAAVHDAGPGDFVYFDPPYDPVTTTANFTSYTAGSFGPDDQRALADLARTLVARGCRVMLSNSDTAFIRSIYRGLTIDRVKCARAINSDPTRRGEVDELIITGGY